MVKITLTDNTGLSAVVFHIAREQLVTRVLPKLLSSGFAAGFSF